MTFAVASPIKTAARRKPNFVSRTRGRRTKCAQFAPWSRKENQRRFLLKILLPLLAQRFASAIHCGQGCRSRCETRDTRWLPPQTIQWPAMLYSEQSFAIQFVVRKYECFAGRRDQDR